MSDKKESLSYTMTPCMDKKGGMSTFYTLRSTEGGQNRICKKINIKQYSFPTMEIAIMASFNYPHLMSLQSYAASNHFGGESVGLIMDPGTCDLFDFRINNHPITDAIAHKLLRYFYHTACAIYVLHCHDIVHLDVKPENIIIKGDTAILTDFGFSEFIPSDNETNSLNVPFREFVSCEYRGSEGYFPIDKEGKNYVYGKASDIWSLALSMYAIISGHSIVADASKPDHFSAWKSSIDKLFEPTCIEKNLNSHFPQLREKSDLIDLLRGMLRYDRHQRFTIKEVVNHRVFASVKESGENKIDTTNVIMPLSYIKEEGSISRQLIWKMNQIFKSKPMERDMAIDVINRTLSSLHINISNIGQYARAFAELADNGVKIIGADLIPYIDNIILATKGRLFTFKQKSDMSVGKT